MPSINITPATGNKNLAAGQYNVIYAAPVGCVNATVNARIVTQDLTKNLKIRLAIVPAGFTDGSTTAPADNTWIAPLDIVLGPNGISSGILEDTAIVLAAGETLVAYSDLGFATARVHGLVRTIGA